MLKDVLLTRLLIPVRLVLKVLLLFLMVFFLIVLLNKFQIVQKWIFTSLTLVYSVNQDFIYRMENVIQLVSLQKTVLTTLQKLHASAAPKDLRLILQRLLVCRMQTYQVYQIRTVKILKLKLHLFVIHVHLDMCLNMDIVYLVLRTHLKKDV